MKRTVFALIASIAICAPMAAQTSWTADNGNGTYTNPLFYDEFPIRILSGSVMISIWQGPRCMLCLAWWCFTPRI